jgi:hypothetical protein
MKITNFSPIIVSKDSDAIIKLFEDMGFEKRHTKTDIEGGQNTNVRMKDADGHAVDVSSSKNVPQDLTAIRVNVDNFDEAYQFLTDHGFRNSRGDKVTKTSSSEDTYMISPSGFAIVLSQHIK